MELAGRVALITGGRRIGAVVALELARAGADIALVYRRSRAEAEETADSLRALDRRVLLIQADLSVAQSCDRAVEDTVNALGRLDVLVNMASVYLRRSIES
jgi:NAD(P)-dependent dehydrogenase (short-subunit alcohol dehydrogenase family)